MRTNYSRTPSKRPPSREMCSYKLLFFVFSQSRALIWLYSSFLALVSAAGELSIISDRQLGLTEQKWNGMALNIFLFLFRIHHLRKATEEKKGNEPVCQNGTANISVPPVPPIKAVPKIPVERNRNGPFHLTSDRNSRNFWHKFGTGFQFSLPVLIGPLHC